MRRQVNGKKKKESSTNYPLFMFTYFLFHKNRVAQVQDSNLINFTENYNNINSNIVTLNILCKPIAMLLHHKHSCLKCCILISNALFL